MKKLFAQAIESTGALALSEYGAFAASIQPESQTPENSPAGFAQKARFKLYAVLCEASERLEPGAGISSAGRRYVLESIETYAYQGKGLFRKGTLLAVEEGEE
jgi:hypothetical protein